MRLVDVKVLEMQTKEAFKENPVVMGMLLRWLRKQPTVDAVPVVRCKDCKYYRIHRDSWGEDIPHCIKAWGGAEVDPMDFCSYGERKDGVG